MIIPQRSFRAGLILFQSKTQLEFMLCIGVFCNNLTPISPPIFLSPRHCIFEGHKPFVHVLGLSHHFLLVLFDLFFWPLYFEVRSQTRLNSNELFWQEHILGGVLYVVSASQQETKCQHVPSLVTRLRWCLQVSPLSKHTHCFVLCRQSVGTISVC